MTQGKKHHNCRKCFQQEKNSLDSTRTSSNRWYQTYTRYYKKYTKDVLIKISNYFIGILDFQISVI